MNTQHILSILKKHWVTLSTTVVVGALLGLVVSAAMPIRYRSTMELLILQRYAFARDAYTASKSIEYLSNVFGEVIYSQSFIDEVLASGYRIDNTFSTNPEKRKKQWKKTVKAQVNRDTGTMSVSILHRDPNQAQQIAQAILFILNSKGDNYHGEGDRVSIKTLDAPFVASRPAQPNLPTNAAVGALLAILAAFTVLANGKEFEFTPRTIRAYFFPPSGGKHAVKVPTEEPKHQYQAMPSPFVFERDRQMAAAPVNEGSPLAAARSNNNTVIPRPNGSTTAKTGQASTPHNDHSLSKVEGQPSKEIGFQTGRSVEEIKKQMRGEK